MALRRIDGELPNDWKNLQINSIAAGKLFYVLDGRNAWHSTWVKRWYEDSFHFTFEGAIAYAEKNRVQGSVFTVHEVATLILETDKGNALVTELFTPSPLSEYKPTVHQPVLIERLNSAPYHWRYDLTMAPNLVRSQLNGNPSRFLPLLRQNLQLVLDSFHVHSLFWQPSEPDRSIVRLLATAKDGDVYRLMREETMSNWKSFSTGSQSFLSWQTKKRVTQSDGIRQILHHARLHKAANLKE